MELPKYARIEYERRWLVDAATAAAIVEGKAFRRRLDDRYLACGRLRLRAFTESDSPRRTFKLTKKYAGGTAEAGAVVSIWLTSDEHDALRALDGLDLTKTRGYDEHGGHLFSVDVFDGALRGLALCSVEADDLEALRTIVPPPYARREVTEDAFFTGGRLCLASSEELAARLAGIGE
jgi:CYTH domain-containing protein